MSRYALDLSNDVLDEARNAAREEGTSVDNLIETIVSDALKQRRELETMRQRARRGEPDAALAILDGLPSLETEAWDELPEETAAPSGKGTK